MNKGIAGYGWIIHLCPGTSDYSRPLAILDSKLVVVVIRPHQYVLPPPGRRGRGVFVPPDDSFGIGGMVSYDALATGYDLGEDCINLRNELLHAINRARGA